MWRNLGNLYHQTTPPFSVRDLLNRLERVWNTNPLMFAGRYAVLKPNFREALVAGMQVSSRHLFEFMDLAAVPLGLRNTLREILESGNAAPFRGYYNWAVNKILKHAEEIDAKQVAELGAGTAPLSRHLLKRESSVAQFVICDINPDVSAYQTLKQRHPGRVKIIETPIDFAKPREWPDSTLLVLSATLHHLPDTVRRRALAAMIQSADSVLIIEPLRNTRLSLLFVCFSIVPAILLPISFIRRPGVLRRVVWCWLLPLAPLMFIWDGWVSCLRQWSDERYMEEMGAIEDVSIEVTHTLFCQAVKLVKQKTVG